MGLRMTVPRLDVAAVLHRFSSLLRSGLTPARPLAMGAASATTDRTALSPALAVRAGVEPLAGFDEQPSSQQQGRGKKRKKEKQGKLPPPPRPTHFLALPLAQHPAITEAILAVQQALVEHSPHLKGACVDPASAHLTLGVMALTSAEEQERAAAVLQQLGPLLRERGLLAPLQLRFGGLSHFRQQVLYLDLAGGGSKGSGDAGMEGSGRARNGLPAAPAAVAEQVEVQAQGLQASAGASSKSTAAQLADSSRAVAAEGSGGAAQEATTAAPGLEAAPGVGVAGQHVESAPGAQLRRFETGTTEVSGRQQLLELAALVRGQFVLAGLLAEDKKQGFEPHVTIAKTSKLVGWGGSRKRGGSSRQHHRDRHSKRGKQETEQADEQQLQQQQQQQQAVHQQQGSAAEQGTEPGDAEQAVELTQDGRRHAQDVPHAAEGRQGGQQSGAAQHERQGQPEQQQEGQAGPDCRRIPEEAYAAHLGISCGGPLAVAELQLCAMQGRKPSCYYPVLASLPLGLPPTALAGAEADQAAVAALAAIETPAVDAAADPSIRPSAIV